MVWHVRAQKDTHLYPIWRQVRHIFQRFVELGSSTMLVKELRLDGVTSKAWTTQDGKVREGVNDHEEAH